MSFEKLLEWMTGHGDMKPVWTDSGASLMWIADENLIVPADIQKALDEHHMTYSGMVQVSRETTPRALQA